MAKLTVDQSGVIALCHEFLLAADSQVDGGLFSNHPNLNPQGSAEDAAIQNCKSLFNNRFFRDTFPTAHQQDIIAQAALEKSGVEYESVKMSLIDQGLESLALLLEHVTCDYK